MFLLATAFRAKKHPSRVPVRAKTLNGKHRICQNSRMVAFAPIAGMRRSVLPGMRPWLVLLALVALALPAVTQALEIRMTAASVDYQNYLLAGLTVSLKDGLANLHIDSVAAKDDPGVALRDVTVRCDDFAVGSEPACAGAPWSALLLHQEAGWRLPVAGVTEGFSSSPDGWAFQTSLGSGKLSARLALQADAGQLQATLGWDEQPISAFAAALPLPEPFGWAGAGTSKGRIALLWPSAGDPTAEFQLATSGLSFDSPDGRFAAEGLALKVAGTARTGEPLSVDAYGEIAGGALLIDNFYTAFDEGAVQWSVRASKQGTALQLSKLQLSDGRSLDVQAEAQLDFGNPLASLRYRVSHFEMHFPEAYQRYIESMASAWTLDGLAMTGSLSWSGTGRIGAPASGALEVEDLSIVDSKRGRFAVTGLAAHIQPGKEGAESRFSWRGLLLRRVNLGAGEAQVAAEPGGFSLTSPLRLDVLGGSVALETLQVSLPGSDAAAAAEPQIRLYATLDQLDMLRLTRALGWPDFEGSISGRIPGVTLKDGVLAVEGTIEFNVFDGQVLLSGLRIERPFGVLPSLAADLDASNLDLQLLTHTFSFGNISGRMSGFVHDLRMLDWKPVAFDAWMGTPPQEAGSHRISRQAVKHLTTIGGGSATAALSGPVLKLFNNFSYKRLGLGCRLQNNVCEVRGLDDDQASVLIMEGSGVPKIMIRAFNRRMDWPTLLAGLSAASAGESIRIGDKP
jgi:hypothetical protein